VIWLAVLAFAVILGSLSFCSTYHKGWAPEVMHDAGPRTDCPDCASPDDSVRHGSGDLAGALGPSGGEAA
jgi:hypothetical protein